MNMVSSTLEPRKAPIQARSSATVEALYIATIQVLTREGLGRCTTTRIAERAGMSVGTLYQYYPNRDALLVAVLEKHLDRVATAVERSCRDNTGKSVAEMASRFVADLLAAKMRDPQESKALYAVAGGRGGRELIARKQERMVKAVSKMLATASDAGFDDPTETAEISLGALFGPLRSILEGLASPIPKARLQGQLARLMTGYLKASVIE